MIPPVGFEPTKHPASDVKSPPFGRSGTVELKFFNNNLYLFKHHLTSSCVAQSSS